MEEQAKKVKIKRSDKEAFTKVCVHTRIMRVFVHNESVMSSASFSYPLAMFFLAIGTITLCRF